MQRSPLPLPEDFDPQVCMPASRTELGTFHETRKAAHLAANLVANGTPQDLELATSVLGAVLECQETDPKDPHYGNFYWMYEDVVVADLNAVAFVLDAIVPMLIRHGERLPEALRRRLLEAVRLGLTEVCRLDVLVAYTNISVLDIHNTCLGGELLEDMEFIRRGRDKLITWIAFTSRSGHPFEFNSPTYTPIVLRVLKQLTRLTRDEATRIRAKTMAARIALSVALRFHPPTGRWAGPHSRAYQQAVSHQAESEVTRVKGWLQDETLPTWLGALVRPDRQPFQVTETAEANKKIGLTTYHSSSFTLGSATENFGEQSNGLIAYYGGLAGEKQGVFYSRYLTNDKWLGDFYHETDRSRFRNLLDEGLFYSAQDGPRVLAAYAPKQLERCSSAKAALIWTQVDEVWVNGNQVHNFPSTVPNGQVVTVVGGNTLFAVRPLLRMSLGRDAPAVLSRRDDHLVLELYQYQGPEKGFWELRWPGAFYQGKPVNSFYLEVAEKKDYESPSAFAEAIFAGDIQEVLEAPFTYGLQGERRWRSEYSRDGRMLGLQLELMKWDLKHRLTREGDIGWPMLESPLARESNTGEVSVGDATFKCEQGPVWLYAAPREQVWVAGYLGFAPTSAMLELPGGRVEIERTSTGLIVWEKGTARVDTCDCHESTRVFGGALEG